MYSAGGNRALTTCPKDVLGINGQPDDAYRSAVGLDAANQQRVGG